MFNYNGANTSRSFVIKKNQNLLLLASFFHIYQNFDDLNKFLPEVDRIKNYLTVENLDLCSTNIPRLS